MEQGKPIKDVRLGFPTPGVNDHLLLREHLKSVSCAPGRPPALTILGALICWPHTQRPGDHNLRHGKQGDSNSERRKCQQRCRRSWCVPGPPGPGRRTTSRHVRAGQAYVGTRRHGTRGTARGVGVERRKPARWPPREAA